MLITIPAAAAGAAGATSVLDLEPLIAYCRQCRPDAVVLMPPIGQDDLPNGAALLTMRNRLEAEGLQTVGGSWRVPADAPVDDPAWEMETLFTARALVAALGEAGVDLLTVDWAASPEALPDWLERLLEEAQRAEVRLAVRSALSAAEADQLLRRLESPFLGLGLAVEPTPIHLEAAPRRIRSLGAKLFTVQLPVLPFGEGETGAAWLPVVRALQETGFRGSLQVDGCETPVEYAQAVGLARGLLLAGGS